MSKNSYYVSKTKKKKETMFLELEKLKGYTVKPNVQVDDMIGVKQIVFVNDEMAEKIIKKKVNKKIDYLLKQLKLINEDDSGNDGNIKYTLMNAEKLRMLLINKYVKYLGNTYHSLTLKKIDLIIEELRYKLYQIEYNKHVEYIHEEENKKEGRRGR